MNIEVDNCSSRSPVKKTKTTDFLGGKNVLTPFEVYTRDISIINNVFIQKRKKKEIYKNQI
jgi:hypothetical protein